MTTRFMNTNLLWYTLATLFAVFVYFYGLDSHHIPKNGDEFPYEHITRMTAASGHLLPLQSELDGMRNTKPPMLFWQGIASTHWGQDWTLWNLRYPSVIYTLLTGALIFLLGWRISGKTSQGFIGMLAFLAFFSTYRFGRPFLTNSPEVFWLFLPFFILLFWQHIAFASRLIPVLIGMIVGIGLLYKSFALLLPVGLGLAWWYLHHRKYRIRDFLITDTWKLALIAVIALSVFGLWFLLDPEPQTIWQEFVVKENVGKFDPKNTGYLAKFLWGTSSIWVLALGYPMNTGLLVFPVAALMVSAILRRKQLSDAEKLLWIWIIVMFAVFCLPSQRSARYLLAAMPALAVLCGLGWHRIGRSWFIASISLGAILAIGAGFLSLKLQSALPEVSLYQPTYWILLATTLAFSIAAIALPNLTRPGAAVSSLLVFLSIAAFLRPFDGALGNYNEETQRQVTNSEVFVPYDFNAKYEMYRFILPGAKIQGYEEQRVQDINELAQRYRLFAIRTPLSTEPCKNCQVLGERLELRNRHTSAELREIMRGNILENVFLKEMLIKVPTGTNDPRSP